MREHLNHLWPSIITGATTAAATSKFTQPWSPFRVPNTKERKREAYPFSTARLLRPLSGVRRSILVLFRPWNYTAGVTRDEYYVSFVLIKSPLNLARLCSPPIAQLWRSRAMWLRFKHERAYCGDSWTIRRDEKNIHYYNRYYIRDALKTCTIVIKGDV